MEDRNPQLGLGHLGQREGLRRGGLRQVRQGQGRHGDELPAAPRGCRHLLTAIEQQQDPSGAQIGVQPLPGGPRPRAPGPSGPQQRTLCLSSGEYLLAVSADHG